MNHNNLPVDTPDDRDTPNGKEEDEPNPFGHIHLHSAEYDYWDGEKCEVEEDVDDIEGETIFSDRDTCDWVVWDAVALQIPAF